jgi:hypothetical protein
MRPSSGERCERTGVEGKSSIVESWRPTWAEDHVTFHEAALRAYSPKGSVGVFSEVCHAPQQTLHKNLVWEYVEVVTCEGGVLYLSLWEREGKRRARMAALNIENTPIGWGFWLRWVLATVIGVVVGIALMFGGVGALLNDTPQAVFGAGLGVVFGTTLGIAQWLVIRLHLGGVGMWVPLTIVGWVVFWALNIAGVFPEGEGLSGKAIEGLWHGLVFGALVGLAQSIALRGRVNGAGWWVVINGVCWSLSAAAGDAGNLLVGNPGGADLLIALLLACGLTGLGMMWLLRRSARSTRG